MDYRSLECLIHSYTISYKYSATLAYIDLHLQRTVGQGFSGFAPSFDKLAHETTNELIKRSSIIKLKWNDEKVKEINRVLNGHVFTNIYTTENTFKASSKKSQILDLAMHALIDHSEPRKSRIIISATKDSVQDDILSALKYMVWTPQAELITLSACNTDFGKLSDGEGVISLARAFSYAGVPSVVISLWKIDDKVTSRLMVLFYQNLANGLEKDGFWRGGDNNWLYLVGLLGFRMKGFKK